MNRSKASLSEKLLLHVFGFKVTWKNKHRTVLKKEEVLPQALSDELRLAHLVATSGAQPVTFDLSGPVSDAASEGSLRIWKMQSLANGHVLVYVLARQCIRCLTNTHFLWHC